MQGTTLEDGDRLEHRLAGQFVPKPDGLPTVLQYPRRHACGQLRLRVRHHVGKHVDGRVRSEHRNRIDHRARPSGEPGQPTDHVVRYVARRDIVAARRQRLDHEQRNPAGDLKQRVDVHARLSSREGGHSVTGQRCEFSTRYRLDICDIGEERS